LNTTPDGWFYIIKGNLELIYLRCFLYHIFTTSSLNKYAKLANYASA
jgi:hypothetical protein